MLDNGTASRTMASMTFTSRAFLTPEAAYHALESDIKERVAKLVKKHGSITRVNEMNPLHSGEPEELEQAAKDDADVEEYLNGWSEDVLTRITVITDDVDEDSSPIDMKDVLEHFVVRYELCDYDDEINIDIQPTSVLMTENASSRLQ